MREGLKMVGQRGVTSILVALVAAVAFSAVDRDASADVYPEDDSVEVYPGNKCASQKLDIAADRCDRLLKIWGFWDRTQFDFMRDWLLSRQDRLFDRRWTAAEESASQAGVDCADMTLSGPELKTLIDTAVDGIVTEVNTGLDLSRNEWWQWWNQDSICGANLLRFAATQCRQIVEAESRYIGNLADDPYGEERDAAQDRADARFSRHWDWAMRRQCPTEATEADIAARIDDLSADALTSITVSPNVPDDQFMAITHPAVGEPGHEVAYEGDVLGPRCQDSSQYSFFARRGTENKLLMYYEGGGACWESLTCGLPRCNQDVDPDAFMAATAEGFGSGFADLNNPDNPFANWNIVYVPYCSCDVHWGDSAVDYPEMVLIPGIIEFPPKHVEHRGYHNAKLAEKWAREHFVNPSDIFVTGSSAGAYGATMHSIPLNEVYPASNINMMADAGNGVITQDFLEQQFGNWGVEQNLPDVPGIGDVPVEEQSMPGIVTAAAAYYPRANWAHYTTAYDGGDGGQTGFYHVMLNPGNFFAWLNWWESSCAFNAQMRQQALDTSAAVSLENDNYRYYIGTGSAHTGFGRDKVYADTTGGVPPLVDWVNAMIDDTPAWTDVEASPSNVLLPGECNSDSDNAGDPCGYDADCPNGKCGGEDPRPSSPTPPFEIVGTDTIINCGP
jgi:hypothetical protein